MRYWLARLALCPFLGHALAYDADGPYPYCTRCGDEFYGGEADIEEAIEYLEKNQEPRPPNWVYRCTALAAFHDDFTLTEQPTALSMPKSAITVPKKYVSGSVETLG